MKILFTLRSSTLGVPGSVFGNPAHAVSFNKIFYDTVSCRVALKGICYQLQMVLRAHAEILMVDKKP